MDTFEVIRKRRSVRAYTGEAIPREDLEKIVDAGRLAATLFEGKVGAGLHRKSWTPSELTGGVYLLKLEAGERSIVRKVVYLP